ncbi:MAG: MazG nucleotide pyrophosphohydrolase domain-containing protein [Pseudomonadota bacterium]
MGKIEKSRAVSTEPGRSILEDITDTLPVLARALAFQNRAAEVGFDWPAVTYVLEKIEEELLEIRHEIAQAADVDRLEDEVGDLMFVCVNLARHLRVDPEAALRRANAKFERRFRRIEALLAERGRTPQKSSLEEMDALWDQVKSEEC